MKQQDRHNDIEDRIIKLENRFRTVPEFTDEVLKLITLFRMKFNLQPSHPRVAQGLWNIGLPCDVAHHGCRSIWYRASLSLGSLYTFGKSERLRPHSASGWRGAGKRLAFASWRSVAPRTGRGHAVQDFGNLGRGSIDGAGGCCRGSTATHRAANCRTAGSDGAEHLGLASCFAGCVCADDRRWHHALNTAVLSSADGPHSQPARHRCLDVFLRTDARLPAPSSALVAGRPAHRPPRFLIMKNPEKS